MFVCSRFLVLFCLFLFFFLFLNATKEVRLVSYRLPLFRISGIKKKGAFLERYMNECLLPVPRDTFLSSHISFPHEEDFVRATGLQKSAYANDTIYCTKAQYQYHMKKMEEIFLHICGKLVILMDEKRALWMKGICLIWSRGRYISPSLPDRGPTGIFNLAHSVSDPRAEISGILVMVRLSNSTFRRTTYWFWLFLYF